ncbi:MAG: HAMP domain-containing protein [Rhodospirillaceae bacterium]|nr:HAMP domain-containing protein [Rhodospirillaceae bacterium]
MTLDARIGNRLFRGKRAPAETGAPRDAPEEGARRIARTRVLWAWLRRRRPSTSLTRRILAINLLVLAVPVGGFFFLDQYQESLIDAEIEALRVQGEVFAGAIGAGAVIVAPGVGQQIDPARASLMLRRLTEPTQNRARLFVGNGVMITDTQSVRSARSPVRVQTLPPPKGFAPWVWGQERFEALLDWLPGQSELPIYQERVPQRANDYREVTVALAGIPGAAVRRHQSGGMVISVSVPIQRYRQVVGALMLSRGSEEVERAMRAIRIDILQVFGVAFAVTILLSVYLAATIARPLRRLALAAQRVRSGSGRDVAMPDFANRRDEIGDLGRDLRAMTEALWQRMDAIERFAADVSHEIKNPLTSLRSAVETVARVEDPEQQKKLMSIILDDVARLDRLISDISDASRLDAELSRDPPTVVDLRVALEALVDIQTTTTSADIVLDLEPGVDLSIDAFEDRLGRVFRNIIANAQSFSPREGKIIVAANRHPRRGGDLITVTVDDQGPGIPEANLESIFKRFYSDRPTENADGERQKFGTHSGLGLSISRQIVEAAGGRVWAENRHSTGGGTVDGAVAGARFVVEFPAAA